MIFYLLFDKALFPSTKQQKTLFLVHILNCYFRIWNFAPENLFVQTLITVEPDNLQTHLKMITRTMPIYRSNWINYKRHPGIRYVIPLFAIRLNSSKTVATIFIHSYIVVKHHMPIIRHCPAQIMTHRFKIVERAPGPPAVVDPAC